MSALLHHLAVAISVARTVARELRRGGLRDLGRNLTDASASELVELEARLVGAPIVEFDPKTRKIKARA